MYRNVLFACCRRRRPLWLWLAFCFCLFLTAGHFHHHFVFIYRWKKSHAATTNQLTFIYSLHLKAPFLSTLFCHLAMHKLECMCVYAVVCAMNQNMPLIAPNDMCFLVSWIFAAVEMVSTITARPSFLYFFSLFHLKSMQ